MTVTSHSQPVPTTPFSSDDESEGEALCLSLPSGPVTSSFICLFSSCNGRSPFATAGVLNTHVERIHTGQRDDPGFQAYLAQYQRYECESRCGKLISRSRSSHTCYQPPLPPKRREEPLPPLRGEHLGSTEDDLSQAPGSGSPPGFPLSGTPFNEFSASAPNVLEALQFAVPSLIRIPQALRSPCGRALSALFERC